MVKLLQLIKVRDDIGDLKGFVLLMSSKVSQRSDVLENACTAFLEELTTCNTTYTMKVNWLERRENTKEAFNVPKASGGITDTSLNTQFSAGSTCVWDVKEDQYSVLGTESESVAQCVYHSLRASLILQNGFIFFLWSKLPQQQSVVPVTGVSLRM